MQGIDIYLLTQIGSWFVDSPNAVEAREVIAYAEKHGYVGLRTHYAPAFPEGAAAYELTDKGLQLVRDSFGEVAYINARRQRDWYRKHSSSRE